MTFATPQEAARTARTKARYGHHDWVRWADKQDQHHTERLSAASIKAAMLAVGTQGMIFLYAANTGTSHILNWWIANNIRRQYLAGHLS